MPSSTAVVEPIHVTASTGPRWVPPLGSIPWQWELAHPLDLGDRHLMGMGATTQAGSPAPDPVVYDIDGFRNPARTVAALHSRGAHVICYVEVGAAESYRPDYGSFPTSTLGSVVENYPQERFLDIRSPAVLKVIQARISMCASKGFDAIEPDIDDSYAKRTGFSLTLGDQVRFNRALADHAHSLGLSYGLKNGDDASFAAQMLPIVDFALAEQCFEYGTCGAFFPSFRDAGLAVFEVEYRLQRSAFCARALAYGFSASRQSVELAGGREPCG